MRRSRAAIRIDVDTWVEDCHMAHDGETLGLINSWLAGMVPNEEIEAERKAWYANSNLNPLYGNEAWLEPARKHAREVDSAS